MGGKIDKALCDHMDDKADPLQAAAHGEETRRHHGAAGFGKYLRPDNDVGDVGLILERHEHHAFRGARPLPHQDQAGDGDSLVLPQFIVTQRRVAQRAERVEAVAEEAHGMFFQRKPGRHVILDHVFAERHLGQGNGFFRKQFVAEMRRQ